MKFFLEFVVCCGSCSAGTAAARGPAEEKTLLVAQEPRRRGSRKQGSGRGCRRSWTPSLSSISEDSLVAERISDVERPVAAWRRRLKRKFSSVSQRDRSRSLQHCDGSYHRRDSLAGVIPAYSPTPFMF